MENWIKADVKFNVGKKKVRFSIVHNMPTDFGLSFENAFDNWVARTNNYTAQSLVDYIESKQTGFVAMTMKRYNQLNSTP